MLKLFERKELKNIAVLCFIWRCSSHRYIFHSSHIPCQTLPIRSRSHYSGSWVTSGAWINTVPCLISPETLLHIPGVWWGYLNPDPRRQKTSQFGDCEEHNTQHSGFRISAQHSSLHCTREGHTIGKEKKLVTLRPSELNMKYIWKWWWLTLLMWTRESVQNSWDISSSINHGAGVTPSLDCRLHKSGSLSYPQNV